MLFLKAMGITAVIFAVIGAFISLCAAIAFYLGGWTLAGILLFLVASIFVYDMLKDNELDKRWRETYVQDYAKKAFQ